MIYTFSFLIFLLQPLSVMAYSRIIPFVIIICSVFSTCAAIAQAKPAKPAKAKVSNSPYAPGPLFDDESVIEFKLSGRLKEIFNNRDETKETYYPMLLQYKKKDSTTVAIRLQVKTRGHFRRKKENCSMPPLLLNIMKESKLKTTVFEKQEKLKLVTPCSGDDYVVREYLVYKLYNLISPTCMRARLAKVTFEDSLGKAKTQTQYCILIEDDNKAAKRSGYFVLDKKMVRMEHVNPEEFTKMAVFEYLIGNTDWSVPYLHNIRLAFKDSTSIPIAIPYDFDHSGIVSAPYALPPEQLELTSVRDRLYRGYCQDISKFNNAFALFNKLKDDIYKVYTTCPYLDAKYVKNAVKYLDDFYKVINNPKTAEREFGDPCSRKAQVVIAGFENMND